MAGFTAFLAAPDLFDIGSIEVKTYLPSTYSLKRGVPVSYVIRLINDNPFRQPRATARLVENAGHRAEGGVAARKQRGIFLPRVQDPHHRRLHDLILEDQRRNVRTTLHLLLEQLVDAGVARELPLARVPLDEQPALLGLVE